MIGSGNLKTNPLNDCEGGYITGLFLCFSLYFLDIKNNLCSIQRFVFLWSRDFIRKLRIITFTLFVTLHLINSNFTINFC